MRIRTIHLTILLSILLPLAVSTGDQARTEESSTDLYEQVPREQREPLKHAVEKLIAAEKKGDWQTVYKLRDADPRESEESFLLKMRHMRLLREFRPYRVTFVPPNGSWNIRGCASYQNDPKGHGHIADITARWTGSCWHLSGVSFVPFGDERKANLRECSLDQ